MFLWPLAITELDILVDRRANVSLALGMNFRHLLILPLFVASLQAASVSDLTFTVASEAGPPPLGDSTEYSVTSCRTNASGSLNIPSTYNGLPVTSIAPMKLPSAMQVDAAVTNS